MSTIEGARASDGGTDGEAAGADDREATGESPPGLSVVDDQPPSAKLVAKVLEHEGTLTQGQLAERTLLPPRTVRYAIGRLEDAGAVESRFSFVDARKRLYTLTVS